MLLSAVSVLVVAQSSSEFLEGLMNNPVFILCATQWNAWDKNCGTLLLLSADTRSVLGLCGYLIWNLVDKESYLWEPMSILIPNCRLSCGLDAVKLHVAEVLYTRLFQITAFFLHDFHEMFHRSVVSNVSWGLKLWGSKCYNLLGFVGEQSAASVFKVEEVS